MREAHWLFWTRIWWVFPRSYIVCFSTCQLGGHIAIYFLSKFLRAPVFCWQVRVTIEKFDYFSVMVKDEGHVSPHAACSASGITYHSSLMKGGHRTAGLYKHWAQLPKGTGLRTAQTTFATTGTEAQCTKSRIECSLIPNTSSRTHPVTTQLLDSFGRVLKWYGFISYYIPNISLSRVGSLKTSEHFKNKHR